MINKYWDLTAIAISGPVIIPGGDMVCYGVPPDFPTPIAPIDTVAKTL